VIEKTLPTADSLQELDKDSVVGCLTFVCQFTWHYFAALGSSLRLRSANSLIMELYRLDVSYDFDAGLLRGAWQQGLTVACSARDTELCQYVDEMMAVAVGSVGNASDLNQVYRLSEIVSCLWNTAVVGPSRPPDLSVMKQALSSSRSVLLKSPWLLAPVLDRSLFVRALDGFEPVAATESVHDTGVTASAALAARFLLTSWKTGWPLRTEMKSSTITVTTAADAAAIDENQDIDDADDNSDVDETATNEEINTLYLEMLMDISVAVVCVQASQSYVSQQPLPQQELQQDFCNLIGRLSSKEAEHLIGGVMDRSITDGEVWSLVLDVVLRQLELCNKEVTERCLSTDPEQFVPLTLSTASTLCVILPRMSRDACRQLAEITVALLLTCDADRIAAFDSTYMTFMMFFSNNNNNNAHIYIAHNAELLRRLIFIQLTAVVVKRFGLFTD